VTVKAANFNTLAPVPPLPLSERVLDRLCDILFASDEIMDMIKVEKADDEMHEVRTAVKQVFDEINRLMMRIAD
jgi:hypothetical protein